MSLFDIQIVCNLIAFVVIISLTTTCLKRTEEVAELKKQILQMERAWVNQEKEMHAYHDKKLSDQLASQKSRFIYDLKKLTREYE